MDITICEDKKGGTARLTTESPASYYGIPILRIEADDVNGDFGPADLLGDANHVMLASQIVKGWAAQPGRTKAELEAARLFLHQ